MRHRQGVQIGDEDQALTPGGMGIILQRHVIADRAEIIAEMRLAGGLDAGNDPHDDEYPSRLCLAAH